MSCYSKKMAFFNFIESFFFVSLGITFILILLIVYHFKQRIVTLEQKYDSIFEIINNMIKEIQMLRNMLFNRNTNTLQPTFNPVSQQTSNVENVLIEQKRMLLPESDVDIDDESDSDVDEESDSDVDEENDSDVDYEIDENDIDVDESDFHKRDPEILHIYDHFQADNDVSDTENVRLLNNDYETIDQFDQEETPIHFDEDIRIISMQDLTESATLNTDDIEQIQVEKLDEDNDNSTLETPNDFSINTLETTREIYRKMNINTLKALVVTKGLSSDPSKMKKQDLLKLLESSNE